MIKVGLFDYSFLGNYSMSCGDDCKDDKPNYIEWVRGEVLPVTFYTDTQIRVVLQHKGIPGKRVALLLEPPVVTVAHYKDILELENEFDYILTYVTKLVGRNNKWKYYPFGSHKVQPNPIPIEQKTKNISMIASYKNVAVGHKLRHGFAKRFGNHLDLYGTGYKSIVSKTIGLLPYRYTVAIENVKISDYFTEKIMDAFLTNTVPIYWGSSAIGQHFNMDGIIPFMTFSDIPAILKECGEDDYQKRLCAVRENFDHAQEYMVAEDVIYWLYYHRLFEGLEKKQHE